MVRLGSLPSVNHHLEEEEEKEEEKEKAQKK